MMREKVVRFQRDAPAPPSNCIQTDMKIQLEQQPPNKPNFGRVVAIAGAVLIVIFIVAMFVLWFGHGRIEHPFGNHHKNPTSQLVLPQATSAHALLA